MHINPICIISYFCSFRYNFRTTEIVQNTTYPICSGSSHLSLTSRTWQYIDAQDIQTKRILRLTINHFSINILPSCKKLPLSPRRFLYKYTPTPDATRATFLKPGAKNNHT